METGIRRGADEDPAIGVHRLNQSDNMGGTTRHVRLVEPGSPNNQEGSRKAVEAWGRQTQREEQDIADNSPTGSRQWLRQLKQGNKGDVSPGVQRRIWAGQSLRGRERTYDVNLVSANMPLYEPLFDEYLMDYFNSPNVRRHLVRLGLVDEGGRIINPRRFKKDQVRLDREEYESRIVKNMEDREFDRAIEVAIRKQTEEGKLQRSKKLLNTTDAELPYPEFLANYPATMTRTALLYSEKSAPLTTAQQMLVAKLKQQAPGKLKALGITPSQLYGRKQQAQEVARRDRAVRWGSGHVDHKRARPRDLHRIKDLQMHKGALKARTAATIHDDLSGDELEGTAGQESPMDDTLSHEDADEVIALFDAARREYHRGKLDRAEAYIRALLSRVGEKDPKSMPPKSAASTETLPKGLFVESAMSSAGCLDHRDVLRARSGRSTPSTPRHRATRPKSARPTRESHFPIATDFSDFENSEGGYESDGEVLMGEDLDPHALLESRSNLGAGSEPIMEEVEGIIQEVVEQTNVPHDPLPRATEDLLQNAEVSDNPEDGKTELSDSAGDHADEIARKRQNSAVKVQALFRGYRTRKDVDEFASHLSDDSLATGPTHGRPLQYGISKDNANTFAIDTENGYYGEGQPVEMELARMQSNAYEEAFEVPPTDGAAPRGMALKLSSRNASPLASQTLRSHPSIQATSKSTVALDSRISSVDGQYSSGPNQDVRLSQTGIRIGSGSRGSKESLEERGVTEVEGLAVSAFDSETAPRTSYNDPEKDHTQSVDNMDEGLYDDDFNDIDALSTSRDLGPAEQSHPSGSTALKSIKALLHDVASHLPFRHDARHEEEKPHHGTVLEREVMPEDRTLNDVPANHTLSSILATYGDESAADTHGPEVEHVSAQSIKAVTTRSAIVLPGSGSLRDTKEKGSDLREQWKPTQVSEVASTELGADVKTARSQSNLARPKSTSQNQNLAVRATHTSQPALHYHNNSQIAEVRRSIGDKSSGEINNARNQIVPHESNGKVVMNVAAPQGELASVQQLDNVYRVDIVDSLPLQTGEPANLSSLEHAIQGFGENDVDNVRGQHRYSVDIMPTPSQSASQHELNNTQDKGSARNLVRAQPLAKVDSGELARNTTLPLSTNGSVLHLNKDAAFDNDNKSRAASRNSLSKAQSVELARPISRPASDIPSTQQLVRDGSADLARNIYLPQSSVGSVQQLDQVPRAVVDQNTPPAASRDNLNKAQSRGLTRSMSRSSNDVPGSQQLARDDLARNINFPTKVVGSVQQLNKSPSTVINQNTKSRVASRNNLDKSGSMNRSENNVARSQQIVRVDSVDLARNVNLPASAVGSVQHLNQSASGVVDQNTKSRAASRNDLDKSRNVHRFENNVAGSQQIPRVDSIDLARNVNLPASAVGSVQQLNRSARGVIDQNTKSRAASRNNLGESRNANRSENNVGGSQQIPRVDSVDLARNVNLPASAVGGVQHLSQPASAVIDQNTKSRAASRNDLGKARGMSQSANNVAGSQPIVRVESVDLARNVNLPPSAVGSVQHLNQPVSAGIGQNIKSRAASRNNLDKSRNVHRSENNVGGSQQIARVNSVDFARNVNLPASAVGSVQQLNRSASGVIDQNTKSRAASRNNLGESRNANRSENNVGGSQQIPRVDSVDLARNVNLPASAVGSVQQLNQSANGVVDQNTTASQSNLNRAQSRHLDRSIGRSSTDIPGPQQVAREHSVDLARNVNLPPSAVGSVQYLNDVPSAATDQNTKSRAASRNNLHNARGTNQFLNDVAGSQSIARVQSVDLARNVNLPPSALGSIQQLSQSATEVADQISPDPTAGEDNLSRAQSRDLDRGINQISGDYSDTQQLARGGSVDLARNINLPASVAGSMQLNKSPSAAADPNNKSRAASHNSLDQARSMSRTPSDVPSSQQLTRDDSVELARNMNLPPSAMGSVQQLDQISSVPIEQSSKSRAVSRNNLNKAQSRDMGRSMSRNLRDVPSTQQIAREDSVDLARNINLPSSVVGSVQQLNKSPSAVIDRNSRSHAASQNNLDNTRSMSRTPSDVAGAQQLARENSIDLAREVNLPPSAIGSVQQLDERGNVAIGQNTKSRAVSRNNLDSDSNKNLGRSLNLSTRDISGIQQVARDNIVDLACNVDLPPSAMGIVQHLNNKSRMASQTQLEEPQGLSLSPSDVSGTYQLSREGSVDLARNVILPPSVAGSVQQLNQSASGVVDQNTKSRTSNRNNLNKTQSRDLGRSMSRSSGDIAGPHQIVRENSVDLARNVDLPPSAVGSVQHLNSKSRAASQFQLGESRGSSRSPSDVPGTYQLSREGSVDLARKVNLPPSAAGSVQQLNQSASGVVDQNTKSRTSSRNNLNKAQSRDLGRRTSRSSGDIAGPHQIAREHSVDLARNVDLPLSAVGSVQHLTHKSRAASQTQPGKSRGSSRSPSDVPGTYQLSREGSVDLARNVNLPPSVAGSVQQLNQSASAVVDQNTKSRAGSRNNLNRAQSTGLNVGIGRSSSDIAVPHQIAREHSVDRARNVHLPSSAVGSVQNLNTVPSAAIGPNTKSREASQNKLNKSQGVSHSPSDDPGTYQLSREDSLDLARNVNLPPSAMGSVQQLDQTASVPIEQSSKSRAVSRNNLNKAQSRDLGRSMSQNLRDVPDTQHTARDDSVDLARNIKLPPSVAGSVQLLNQSPSAVIDRNSRSRVASQNNLDNARSMSRTPSDVADPQQLARENSLDLASKVNLPPSTLGSVQQLDKSASVALEHKSRVASRNNLSKAQSENSAQGTTRSPSNLPETQRLHEEDAAEHARNVHLPPSAIGSVQHLEKNASATTAEGVKSRASSQSHLDKARSQSKSLSRDAIGPEQHGDFVRDAKTSSAVALNTLRPGRSLAASKVQAHSEPVDGTSQQSFQDASVGMQNRQTGLDFELAQNTDLPQSTAGSAQYLNMGHSGFNEQDVSALPSQTFGEAFSDLSSEPHGDFDALSDGVVKSQPVNREDSLDMARNFSLPISVAGSIDQLHSGNPQSYGPEMENRESRLPSQNNPDQARNSTPSSDEITSSKQISRDDSFDLARSIQLPPSTMGSAQQLDRVYSAAYSPDSLLISKVPNNSKTGTSKHNLAASRSGSASQQRSDLETTADDARHIALPPSVAASLQQLNSEARSYSLESENVLKPQTNAISFSWLGKDATPSAEKPLTSTGSPSIRHNFQLPVSDYISSTRSSRPPSITGSRSKIAILSDDLPERITPRSSRPHSRSGSGKSINLPVAQSSVPL